MNDYTVNDIAPTFKAFKIAVYFVDPLAAGVWRSP
jgi:hypothetical protein